MLQARLLPWMGAGPIIPKVIRYLISLGNYIPPLTECSLHTLFFRQGTEGLNSRARVGTGRSHPVCLGAASCSRAGAGAPGRETGQRDDDA